MFIHVGSGTCPGLRMRKSLIKYNWQILLSKGRKVKPLSVYWFTGWTRLLDRKNTSDIHTMELWLRMKKRDQKNEIIMRLARRDKLSEGKTYH